MRNKSGKSALPARRRRKGPLARIEDWLALDAGERRRRAAEASRDGDVALLLDLALVAGTLRGRVGRDSSPRTLRSYRTGARQFIEFCRSVGRKPHQVTLDDGYHWVERMRAAGRRPATITARVAAARWLLAGLAWAGLVEGDPLEGLRVSAGRGRRAEVRPYSERELCRLIEMAAPRERAAVLLGCDAGLRVAEVAAIRWRDVHLTERWIRVRRGKGGKSAVVAITERCARALSALRREREAVRREDLVIGVGARRIQQAFRSLCRDARVRPRGFHALRHAAGTRLYAATQDLVLVARHLRHASTRTSEIYVHLADRFYRSAVEQLEGKR